MIRTFLPALAIACVIAAPAFAADTKPPAPAKPVAASTASAPVKAAMKTHKKHKTHAAPPTAK